MKEQLIKVELTAFNRVEVTFPLNYPIPEFYIYRDGEIFDMEYLGILTRKNGQTLVCTYPHDIILNHDYYALIGGKKYLLDTRKAIDFIGFDDRYFYEGNDLGATYTKDHTDFRLFAPLASKVVLKLINQKHKSSLKMEPQDDGTFYLFGYITGRMCFYFMAFGR